MTDRSQRLKQTHAVRGATALGQLMCTKPDSQRVPSKQDGVGLLATRGCYWCSANWTLDHHMTWLRASNTSSCGSLTVSRSSPLPTTTQYRNQLLCKWRSPLSLAPARRTERLVTSLATPGFRLREVFIRHYPIPRTTTICAQ